MNSTPSILLVLVLVLIQNSQCAPSTKEGVSPWKLPPTNSDGVVQIDDMLFPPMTSTSGRAGVLDQVYRWPNRVVVYALPPNLTETERSLIAGAIAEIEQKTCIRFRQRTTERTYVRVVKGSSGGCTSYVGRITHPDYEPQTLNLQSPGCMHHGIIVHEFIHVIGFHHEHCRTDRDAYVTVHLENVQSGFEFAFDKYGADYVSDFNVTYDYDSVMHYGAYDFTNNGRRTIVPKQNVQIGQRIGLSPKDAQKINNMYGC